MLPSQWIPFGKHDSTEYYHKEGNESIVLTLFHLTCDRSKCVTMLESCHVSRVRLSSCFICLGRTIARSCHEYSSGSTCIGGMPKLPWPNIIFSNIRGAIWLWEFWRTIVRNSWISRDLAMIDFHLAWSNRSRSTRRRNIAYEQLTDEYSTVHHSHCLAEEIPFLYPQFVLCQCMLTARHRSEPQRIV